LRREVSVFAVEDGAAQVCWRGLPEGSVLEAGDARAEVGDNSIGAVTLDGLPPDTSLELWVRTPDTGQRRLTSFRTLAPPPGRLLCRFATVNDIHIGERAFGLLRTLRRAAPTLAQSYSALCARAAVDEAMAWGAEVVVAKGDLTYHGWPEEWEEVGRLLSGLPVPVDVLLGNHDVSRRAADGRLALAPHGIDIPTEPFARDLPGIRLVLAHSEVRARSGGHMSRAQRGRVGELLKEGRRPAFLTMHHYPQRHRLPTSYPPGIPGREARALLDTVVASNPATFVSTGHSHRHRRRHHGPVVITEIGATMHYPGTWAGYAVHEGGIRQVVRRVAAPEAMEWTERTRKVLLGVWRLWTPGLRADRCFSHTWPEPR
jgi:3',5'-cyclic-AMP phosphodiesterase